VKLTIVGTGYIGVVVAAGFAETGHNVKGLDVDAAKVEQLRQGHVPFYEPGLEDLVRRNLQEGRLSFTTDPAEAIPQAEIIFLCVDTPSWPDGSPDLSRVLAACETIAKYISPETIVVIKSTVPVGTTERIRGFIQERTSTPFEIAVCPEFLKEGDAIRDFLKPDRVVIGVDSPEVGQILKELHEPFVRTGKPILIMDLRSAELTKYAANALLATKISFMNELSALCERVGADIEQIRKGVGADSRIGPHFLFAGLGWGGSCFPKDVRALVRLGQERGVELLIAQAAYQVNQRQQERFFLKILEHFRGDLAGRMIALWGLSFKPKTDDLREAPALTLIEKCLECGARVRAFDPQAHRKATALLGKAIELANSPYECLQEADALVLATEWEVFRSPDWERVKALMKSPVIFDGRNIYNPDKLRALGFVYYGVGRP
jgi:UDPglucose 6-dehydrogenase